MQSPPTGLTGPAGASLGSKTRLPSEEPDQSRERSTGSPRLPNGLGETPSNIRTAVTRNLPSLADLRENPDLVVGLPLDVIDALLQDCETARKDAEAAKKALTRYLLI